MSSHYVVFHDTLIMRVPSAERSADLLLTLSDIGVHTEVANASIRHIANDPKEEEQICLNVRESFTKLIHLEVPSQACISMIQR